MTKNIEFDKDIFGNPTVTIDAKEIAGTNNKSYVVKQCIDLRKKDIDFTLYDKLGKGQDINTGLVSTVRNEAGTSLIHLEISKWAIPYILYWGDGVGYTLYDKVVSIKLNGYLTKRIYKLICRWKDRGGFTMPIDEFKDKLGITGKYERARDLKEKVLMVAKERIEAETGGKMGFEVSLDKVNSKKINMVTFKIFSEEAKNLVDNTGEWYQTVYIYLRNRTYHNATDNRAQMVADMIRDNGQMRDAFTKFNRLDDYLTSGKYKGRDYTITDFIRMSHKILREDFSIILDEVKNRIQL